MTTVPGFAIDGRLVGPDAKPYLIAEMSARYLARYRSSSVTIPARPHIGA